MSSENLLMVADSEHDANMLYAVRMFVPDPFIYMRINGRCNIVMNDLEIDRARKQASHCRVISHSKCIEQLRKANVRKINTAAIIKLLLNEKGIRRIFVPGSFPHGLARELRQVGITVDVK